MKNSILLELQWKMNDAKMFLCSVKRYVEFYCQKKRNNFFCVCRLIVDLTGEVETHLQRMIGRLVSLQSILALMCSQWDDVRNKVI